MSRSPPPVARKQCTNRTYAPDQVLTYNANAGVAAGGGSGRMAKERGAVILFVVFGLGGCCAMLSRPQAVQRCAGPCCTVLQHSAMMCEGVRRVLSLCAHLRAVCVPLAPSAFSKHGCARALPPPALLFAN